MCFVPQHTYVLFGQPQWCAVKPFFKWQDNSNYLSSPARAQVPGHPAARRRLFQFPSGTSLSLRSRSLSLPVFPLVTGWYKMLSDQAYPDGKTERRPVSDKPARTA